MRSAKRRGWLLITGQTRRRALMATAGLVLLLCCVTQSPAINIVMTFNSGASDFPAYDPDGAKLTALMGSVESYYQDIFEASATLNVEFYYDNIDSLAVHNNTGTSGGKPTSCRIRVDTDPTWYFDETPLDNSEFNMTRYLYRDLDATKQAAYYNGSPPNLLEYAYKGNDNGSGPPESSSGYDLWSILLHEMGHGLGMTGNVAFWEAWFDEEYDVDADLVWGSSMAVPCYSSDDIYHIAGRTNMYPYSSAGQRVLPSATDIFAIETTCGWGDTTIDLKRKEFYSTSANADFNNRDNWAGHKTADSGDDVWVRDGGDATLSAAITVNNLVISEGVTVYTGAFRLYADQYATLGDGTNYGRVYINNGGEFQVDYTLTVSNNAKVEMVTGALLDVDSLTINNGGEVLGAGTIDIEDGLINRGTITVSGGDLVIDSDVTVNLDGEGDYDGDGQLYVTGGNFSCNKALTDTFSGYAQVDAGYLATFTGGWRLGGTLFLNGGANSSTRAGIEGGLFRVAGTLNVNQQGRIYCQSEIENVAVVTLTDSDDTLYLQDNSLIEAGATFSGAGRVYATSTYTLTLEDGATIGVRLHTNGTITVEGGGIGDATINGAFTMGSTATLLAEVAGDGLCDLLDVNAAVSLTGILSIDFLDTYAPTVGDTFTVLTYDSRSGSFASIVSDDPLVGLTADYGATGLTLTVSSLGEGAALMPVPEPGVAAMLLALGGIAIVGRAPRR